MRRRRSRKQKPVLRTGELFFSFLSLFPSPQISILSVCIFLLLHVILLTTFNSHPLPVRCVEGRGLSNTSSLAPTSTSPTKRSE